MMLPCKQLYRHLLLIVAMIAVSPHIWASPSETELWYNSPVITSKGCQHLTQNELQPFADKFIMKLQNRDKKKTEYKATKSTLSTLKIANKKLLESYKVSAALILRSQMCLSHALGLKKHSKKLDKQLKILTSGATLSRKQIKKQRKLTAETNKIIVKTAKAQQQLKPQQKKSFQTGTIVYSMGLEKTYHTFLNIQYNTDVLKSLSFDSTKQFGKRFFADLSNIKGKLSEANQVRKEIISLSKAYWNFSRGMKNYIKDLMKTFKFLGLYTKTNKIKLPADATKRLEKYDDWDDNVGDIEEYNGKQSKKDDN